MYLGDSKQSLEKNKEFMIILEKIKEKEKNINFS